MYIIAKIYSDLLRLLILCRCTLVSLNSEYCRYCQAVTIELIFVTVTHSGDSDTSLRHAMSC